MAMYLVLPAFSSSPISLLSTTKDSMLVKVWGKCIRSVTRPVFTLLAPRPTSKLDHHPLSPWMLSATTYSIYSQLPSILAVVPPSANWGRAMPWWQEPTYHGSYLQELVQQRLFKERNLVKSNQSSLIFHLAITHRKSYFPLTSMWQRYSFSRNLDS